jgi:hypothetical protein
MINKSFIIATMPKLRLKRTPQEEAARQWRKQKRKGDNYNGQGADIGGASTSTSTTRKRRRTHSTSWETRPWASSDEEPEVTPPASPYDAVHNEEEQQFREKMFDALQDDDYLDSLEARLNDFAHVPGRWRSDQGSKHNALLNGGYGMDDIFQLDPQGMDDEEYTEWIRLGMYRFVCVIYSIPYIDLRTVSRRTHAKEHAEREQKRALKAARRAEEKARRAETKRLEKVSEEHRIRKKLEREIRRNEIARTEYDLRWTQLSCRGSDVGLNGRDTELKFSDIPWPILVAYPEERNRSLAGLRPVTLKDLTAKDISDFLFGTSSASTANAPEAEKKQRKETLKETFLRFHPDKFEGRFIKRIHRDERDVVKEAIGQVVRALNSLMDEDG